MASAPPHETTEDAARLASRNAYGPLRYLFIAGFAVAASVTALAVLLTTGQPAGRAVGVSSGMPLLLSLNLLLVLALTAALGWRVWRVFGAGVSDAAARLHRRFVILFGIAAVAPAIIVALFFGVVVTRGVEEWFSQRVRTVVENAAAAARANVNEQESVIGSRVQLMAEDLNQADVVSAFERSRLQYSNFLAQQAAAREFLAIYVIDAEGRVLARAEGQVAPAYVVPPPADLRGAEKEIPLRFDSEDMARAVHKLTAYPDAFLYTVRPMGAGIVGQLRRADDALESYRDADRNRGRIQWIFVLSYVCTSLLVLVGAVWVGMTAAARIAAPIARLVRAADQVAGGDLGARVATDDDPEEIAVLSHAFNRMTGDLQAQQAALRAAGDDAEMRRRFIEAVLSGVSAGVIGLDPQGRISAINAPAMTLLGLKDSARGQALEEAAPELAPIAAQAALGDDAEAEVDVVRRSETRRLRVRASSEAEGGLVLTFDDITRLVAAQRNAAWRDVARRIAHEIKNPLTPIQLSAERLRRKYRPQIQGDLETFDRCTDTIVRQVGDIGRMVDEFSAFARMPAPKFASEDAAELLRQAVFAQRVAYPDVQVDLEDAGEPLPLVCDGRMVGQALANVLKNAGEAVRARVQERPEPKGRITARLVVDGDQMRFEVEDNGVGLPAKDRDRLTEPYVTTREKGTGLGLAIVKRILEEHGGELVLADAPSGEGAMAVLRFPSPSGATAARTPADASVA